MGEYLGSEPKNGITPYVLQKGDSLLNTDRGVPHNDGKNMEKNAGREEKAGPM